MDQKDDRSCGEIQSHTVSSTIDSDNGDSMSETLSQASYHTNNDNNEDQGTDNESIQSDYPDYQDNSDNEELSTDKHQDSEIEPDPFNEGVWQ